MELLCGEGWIWVDLWANVSKGVMILCEDVIVKTHDFVC